MVRLCELIFDPSLSTSALLKFFTSMQLPLHQHREWVALNLPHQHRAIRQLCPLPLQPPANYEDHGIPVPYAHIHMYATHSEQHILMGCLDPSLSLASFDAAEPGSTSAICRFRLPGGPGRLANSILGNCAGDLVLIGAWGHF